MNDENDYEGSVSVNDNVTPVTREKVADVNSLRWEDASTSQLFDQQAALHSRLQKAYQLGNPYLIQQLQEGLQQLEQIISSRKTNSGSTFLM